jgi:hypothetical protein
VKWILAAGVAVAVATILYAWYRGGEEASHGAHQSPIEYVVGP